VRAQEWVILIPCRRCAQMLGYTHVTVTCLSSSSVGCLLASRVLCVLRAGVLLVLVL
jgi:hypothetical protein